MFSNHAPPAASRRRPFWAMRKSHTALPVIAAAATFAAAAFAAADLPGSMAAPGETPIATIHAEGAHECMADAAGNPPCQFREPLATLLSGGMRTAESHE